MGLLTRRRVETDLERKHREFKEQAARVLHREADEREYCSGFEDVICRYGLPPRPGKSGNYPTTVVGEATEQEFEQWRRRTARALHLAGSTRAVYKYEEILREAGLTQVKFRVQTRWVEGTFRVPVTIEVYEDEDPQIDRVSVQRAISSNAEDDRVTWTIGDEV